MTARRLRFYLVFAATLVAGFVLAMPAWAAGPMCDDRAATAVAPSPTLIAPQESLVLDAGDDGCVDRFLEQAGLHRGPAPWERTSTPDCDAVVPRTAPVIAPRGNEILPVVVSDHELPKGVRARVDRPPRA